MTPEFEGPVGHLHRCVTCTETAHANGMTMADVLVIDRDAHTKWHLGEAVAMADPAQGALL